ncbi:tRNA preQ1(34) S-adenosylmethionine ribosyltransferase-isomerase QueA|uniref:S-adenosylmethionine:tRNA ribosyltransferase-isomerase n=1 Tax=Dendrosporobacter quercicolus TaxID=146817 RepID=A0A1G9KPG3_9FIRM|nr:tRNA preQ1(34) S-adenosylmethionine ribosyltransferase-isomerase QueA [Dendrosporobacter quercicolus]NSL46467.1 tRNA preQ1(34) S-adenosylmethionine ribosyltransferase-isomerase QueA [Dendrosporobacter quercicolus DSM 1736]SDL51579.1 S-adenosylmethionine:tRNA ribosyltransferase-isomerase [Dendrosporobacter quercicolus]
MLLADFDYELPEELIAQRPHEPRDGSRLIVLNKETGKLAHRHFYDVPGFLESGDTLIFNDTKVLPARLIGIKRETGAKIEVFLLNRKNGDDWEVLVKPGKRVRPGAVIRFSDELSCEIIAATDFGGRIARFSYQGIFEELLDRLGDTPLPPYIKEKLADKDRYQTVYARFSGSAAAPTAGLHFTPELMQEIADKGVHLGYVTLHVGLGTFRPVNVEQITEHVMHSEYYSVPEATAQLINRTRERGKRVIAVGTTAIRTLETAGAGGKVAAGSGWTNIFIYPGYQFNMIDGLITNFHLPKSTLLMLVSAFAGRDAVMDAYREAIERRYRFFSFGDAMLII